MRPATSKSSIDADSVESRQGFQLQWIESALALLNLGNEGLGVAQGVRDVDLGLSPGQSLSLEPPKKGLLGVRIDALHIPSDEGSLPFHGWEQFHNLPDEVPEHAELFRTSGS